MGDKAQRVKGVTLSIPIVYGSLAWSLGKKAEAEKTHRWTLYVRDPYNQDLSHVIEKVVFHLHESFEDADRVAPGFPFQMFETGWGEFEICISVHFKDPAEKPAEVLHMLKLYHDDGSAPSTKKPVVSEHYDEIIIQDPTQHMYNCANSLLMQTSGKMVAHPDAGVPYAAFENTKQLETLRAARVHVTRELELLREAYLAADAEAYALDMELTKTVAQTMNPTEKRDPL
eukprot:TRINITY_DN8011_c0_g1_i1.p1 TRINITY_DN8011_c0_g1~~TRINITY_DN8011_c0_g1_i1.p1  ORF type:complete len:229 (-),score=39.79 TRINITY_DN8011_c0_g1_i1:323-1009(-)